MQCIRKPFKVSLRRNQTQPNRAILESRPMPGFLGLRVIAYGVDEDAQKRFAGRFIH